MCPLSFPTPSRNRIDEIASWLPETPGHLGPTIYDRHIWAPLAQTAAGQSIITNAGRLLDTPVPILPDELYMQYLTIGNRSNYEKIFFDRMHNRLGNLVTAEMLENRGRFLPAIEAELTAWFKEKSWVLPAHDTQLTNFNGTANYADLFCSEVCARLALLDWWLQDRLLPDTRRQLRREIERRMFTAYRTVIRTGRILLGQWWVVGENNWNAVCHSQLLLAALLLLPDRRERAEMLAAAERAMGFFTSGFADDGYCTEGLEYWQYGFGRFVLLAEITLKATAGRLNFYDNANMEKVAAYARDIHIDTRNTPAFADCTPRYVDNSNYLRILQFRYPKAMLCRTPRMDDITCDSFGTLLNVFANEEEWPPEGVPESVCFPLRSMFASADIYIGRSISENGKLGVAFKLGRNNEQHNHNDIGSFTVVYDGHDFFRDPGGEPYTSRTFSAHRYDGKLLSSFGHMVPVVAGTLQPPGPEQFGAFTKKEFTDDVDTLVADLKGAYPQAKDLKSLQRTVIFNRKEQTLTVRDDVEFETPQTFEMALITGDALDYPAPGTIAAVWNGKRFYADITVDGAGYTLSPCHIPNAPKPDADRVGIVLDAPVLKAATTIVFHA